MKVGMLEMSRRLLDHTKLHAATGSVGAIGTDAWIIEVLIDTIAVALHLPIRLLLTPCLDRALAVGEPLGDMIRREFGDLSVFRTQLKEIVADAGRGMTTISCEQSWIEVEKELDGFILTSNSDPFWTIMRGLAPYPYWEILWLLSEYQNNSEIVSELPEPFSGNFIVCKATTPKLNLQLIAGPVWRWGLGSCDEPGVALDGSTAVLRIAQAFHDHIRRHTESAAGEPVGIFSSDRLERHIVARPPMLPADVRRRVRLASSALAHALCVEIERPPKVAELVSIAISALHLAERLESAAVGFRPETEIWHRLEAGDEGTLGECVWLSSRLIGNAGRTAVGSSKLHPAPPPDVGSAVTVFDMSTGGDHNDELALAHLMVDYATGRSAYIRERMIIFRLWSRDNFARWLTTPNLSEHPDYTKHVDPLVRRIAFVFLADRCAIFQYNAENQTLDRLGLFSRDEENDDHARAASYKKIQDTGRDQARRRISPRYQAIDQATPIHFIESRDDPRRSEGRRPGSRLVVPIVVFGRPLGVIELVGLRPYQFLSSTMAWLNEFSRLLGPDLYVEGVLNHLYEISKSDLDKKPKEDQFRGVLGQLARIFVAGSGAMYLQHPRRTAEFVCVAFFGRPGDLPDGRLSGFNLEDSVSQSASIIRDDRKTWLAGRIGEAPFDAEWAARPKTQALRAEGYQYIAMMPLRDGSGRVLGCISLAAREGGYFENRFQWLADFVTRHAGVAIEAIQLKHRPDESKRELMAHSLKSRVDRVAGAADTLTLLLASFFGDAGDADRISPILREIELEAARHRLTIYGHDKEGPRMLRALQRAFEPKGKSGFAGVLSDLQQHTSDLRRTAEFLAGGVRNEENPFETTEAQWTGTPTALRDCLLGSVVPVARQRRADVVTPPPQELGFEVRLRVPTLVMSDIINNFCDNAIKYRTAGTVALIRFRWIKGASAHLEFRNLAPRLTDDELVMIGTSVFRSEYAKSRSRDGQGRGLFSNRQLAERWKMKFVHRQEDIAGKEASTDIWHVFGLDIPPDLIFEDVSDRPMPVERPRRS